MAPNASTGKPSNPNEHLEIPKWINEDYFQSILEEHEPNFKRIINFTPIAATQPGENYTSVMVRVVMDIELSDGLTKQTSYILKTCLDASNGGAAMVSAMNLFPKEKKMYETIIPSFMKLYKEVGVDIQIGPPCLQIEETPERITLIMEDLKTKNFQNVDRLKGFDLPHMRCVLHKLAEFHAASAMYYELNGPYEEMFHISFFNENNRHFFESNGRSRQESFIRSMHMWDLEDVEYFIKKTPTNHEYFDEAIRMNTVDPQEFSVLNHGDCWANNVMFNYNENGEINETTFVDFQVGKWGTPAQDLWYLITTSASLDIKVQEFDNFIHIYHQRLAECLKLLQYPKAIPSLKNLHIMMLKYGYWGILTSVGTLVAVLMPSDKDANMENFLKDTPEADAIRDKMFCNPYYGKAMAQLYPFFDKKGLFEIDCNY